MRAEPLDLRKDIDVLQVLLERRDAGTPPGRHEDGHTVAIVVAGGGMRGGSTGGMVLALEEAGLSDCFDVAYGASSGAFIASAMIHGRGHAASRIFREDMSAREFIDVKRLWSRSPVMSLDHLLDEILAHSKPIDWAATIAHPAPMHIVVTDAETLEPVDLTGLETPEQWQRAFKATSAVPGFAGGAIEIDGHRYIDGSVSEPLPAMRAIRDGATHVLALLTWSEESLLRHEPSFYTQAERVALDRVRRGLGGMAQGRLHYARELTDLASAPARVYAMSNPVSTGVKSLTRDLPKLERDAALGYTTAQAALYRAITHDREREVR
ncbi:patatin-like phospholipase family protein [Blastococcus sp. Marseille-P5729]|uniref:patatin-like phospholipase family protein n=1 Tax=Blastococcus sp. Marseille-P5729 TaxID=2086582 RepID=UPI00131C11EC|nr:patatin-like phospholipase family protein [Blastococcus sp. Marseille-P5729]